MFDASGDRFRDLLDFDTDDSKFQFWGSVLPRLTPEQFAALKNAIATGVWAGRIVVDEIGRLLYGHDAYHAFRQLGLPPRHVLQVKVGDRTAAEVESLIRLWRYCDGGPMTQAEKREAIRRQLRVTPDWSDAAIARLLGCSDKTVAAVRAAMEETSEIPRFRCQGGRGITRGLPMVLSRDRKEAKKNAPLIRDTRTLDAKGYSRRVLRRKLWEQERDDMARLGASMATPENVKLFTCDFRDLNDKLPSFQFGGRCLTPGSVDLFWTDPPWDLAAVDLYTAFSLLAKRWLKPGGLLCVYTGTVFKDQANDALRLHFQKVWELIVLNKEAGSSRMIGNFQSTYQPILVFSHGELTQKFWMGDSYPSKREEKLYHDWQRTENETLHWLERLTKPGQLVVDPFGGGFTTADCCLKLGLRCVSCDIEERYVSIGTYRVATAWEEMQAARRQ